MLIESNSKQTRVCQKKTFCCFNFENSEIGQKLDGKAEIEEKIDENLEILTPLRPPLPPIKQFKQHFFSGAKSAPGMRIPRF